HHPAKPPRHAGRDVLAAGAAVGNGTDLEEMHHSRQLHAGPSVVARPGKSPPAGLIKMPVPRVNRAARAKRRNVTAALQLQQRPIATGKVWIGRSAAPRHIDIEPEARMQRALEMPSERGCPCGCILGKGSWCWR